jgi:DNA topoisomerase-1
MYGDQYLPAKPNYYKNKARNAQEAHEAIRPSHMNVGFAQISKEVGPAEAKLYELIYKRTIASQMSEKISEVMSVKIDCAGSDNHTYTFGLGAEKVIFDGFRRAYQRMNDEGEEIKTDDGLALQVVGDLREGDVLDLKAFNKLQKFTEPKPRYNEASLVKALEYYGVGRPSTYSTIITTIIDRGYVLRDRKTLLPSDIGMVVVEFLEKNFTKLVDYEYTAGVEKKLDDMAEGKVKYVPFMDGEYKPFEQYLKSADSVDKNSIVILGKSEEKCPICTKGMVIRVGRYGKFLSCSDFPTCKGMKALSVAEGGAPIEEVTFDPEKFLPAEPCPKCGGEMELKASRFGKFWACKSYPKCKGAVPLKLKEACPDCGKPLVERKGRWGKTFTGCSGYPDCHYIKKVDGKGGKSGRSNWKSKAKVGKASNKAKPVKSKTVKTKVAKPKKTIAKSKAK